MENKGALYHPSWTTHNVASFPGVSTSLLPFLCRQMGWMTRSGTGQPAQRRSHKVDADYLSSRIAICILVWFWSSTTTQDNVNLTLNVLLIAMDHTTKNVSSHFICAGNSLNVLYSRTYFYDLKKQQHFKDKLQFIEHLHGTAN